MTRLVTAVQPEAYAAASVTARYGKVQLRIKENWSMAVHKLEEFEVQGCECSSCGQWSLPSGQTISNQQEAIKARAISY
eukprot:scaffold40837_cov29-Prasinocladus_malaysianus.AAC.1